ncbi:mycofactocin-coupled SDR family oxidoreductase [Streptomyces sp. CA-106131]|uniref:mycofactocin-coupled SDR family oxidoreductase n=1 Tax=Streptomyces sp. CA-106131 TaxID=3240045 RepID=UPI003D89FE3B
MGKLDGKVAFLTGAARGQGRSHALTLGREGAAIVMVDNLLVDTPYQRYPGGSPEEYAETQDLLKQAGVRFLALTADVRNQGELQAAVAQGTAEFGPIDITVANAGSTMGLKPMGEIEPEEWARIIDTNLTGVYNTIRATLPDMVARRSGRIIATASMAGRSGYANGSAYGASKWGVIGLIKCVANEYGKYGITANAVCPTNVNSKMIHNQGTYDVFVPDVENPTRAQAEERMKVMHPLGVPYVEPEDISQAVLFLASDAARYVSGEALTVSAGLIAMNAA